jgi:hypothetical protein
MSANDFDEYTKITALARDMSEHPPDSSLDALEALVGKAIDHIPAADYAGITIVEHHDEVVNLVSTHEHPRTLDTIQHKHREGPCFAAATRDSHYIRNLNTEQRWPMFCTDALAHTPVQSIASYQLFSTRKSLGALNLYANTVDAFDQHSLELGYVFAAHTAIIRGTIRRSEQFCTALDSRDTIGQAKGMLMERYDIDAVEAFGLLRKLSQDENIRVCDLARRLIDIDHPTRFE